MLAHLIRNTVPPFASLWPSTPRSGSGCLPLLIAAFNAVFVEQRWQLFTDSMYAQLRTIRFIKVCSCKGSHWPFVKWEHFQFMRKIMESCWWNLFDKCHVCCLLTSSLSQCCIFMSPRWSGRNFIMYRRILQTTPTIAYFLRKTPRLKLYKKKYKDKHKTDVEEGHLKRWI